MHIHMRASISMIIHMESADAVIITVNSRKMRIQQYLHTCLTITAIMLRSLQPLQSI